MTGNNIQVNDGDIITVTYNDTNPVGSRVDTAVWNLNSHGIVFFENDWYSHALTGIRITVIDEDIIDQEVDILVTSITDSTGTTITLSEDIEGIFEGYVFPK